MMSSELIPDLYNDFNWKTDTNLGTILSSKLPLLQSICPQLWIWEKLEHAQQEANGEEITGQI